MNNIVAFLTAQYDAAEAAARESGPARVAWLTYRRDNGEMDYTTVASAHFDDYWVANGRELGTPASARVVYDPARVLAEIAAKRAILNEHNHVPENGGEYTKWDFGCATCHIDSHCGTVNGYGWCPTVRMLAAPYADAEGYDPDWRIT